MPPAAPADARPHSLPGLARRAVLLFARPNARVILPTLAGALAVAVASAAEPMLFRGVVDRLGAAAARRAPGDLFDAVRVFALVLACRIIGQAWVTTATWRVRLNWEYQLRSRVAAKLSVLSARTHSEIGTGGLRFAVDACAPQSASAFTDIAFRLLPTLLYLALAAAGMWRLSPALAVAVFALVPLPGLAAVLAGPAQTRRDASHHAFWTRLWAWYTEVLHGMGTVRAFAKEGDEQRAFLRRQRWAFRSIRRGVHVDAQVTAAAGLAELLARIVVLGYGGVLVARGALTVGALLAVLGYVAGVFAPVQLLVDLYPTARKAVVALESVYAVLDAEEEAPDVAGAEEAPALRGHVRFDDVAFGYRADRLALDGVSVTVRPGETVALVGPSGSGKSTVLRLLQRQHHPTAGRVLLDGRDLRTLAIASVRRQLGVVPQDVVLFNDSVAANIAYGRPSATRAEVEAAARAANADEFIRRLPGGYQFRVGEGGRALSGGQRQRIAIARAFLMDPAVLLLDEATAALDTESEQAVQAALGRLRSGRTTFIVAHRLNTVRDADRILVVRDGRVVGDGTHDTLLAGCPTYQALVRHQLSGPEADPGEAPAPLHLAA